MFAILHVESMCMHNPDAHCVFLDSYNPQGIVLSLLHSEFSFITKKSFQLVKYFSLFFKVSIVSILTYIMSSRENQKTLIKRKRSQDI